VQVRLRQYVTPFERPLTVAVTNGEASDVMVAAGFYAQEDLILGREFRVLGDDLGAVDEAVRAWLSGDVEAVNNIQVQQPGSRFQLRVWSALGQVTAGDTCTYGELAAMIGHPGAARAVGSACGANGVAPFVPCHRVLPASGGIGQYGYGASLKRALLKREGIPV
jgi:methylated-DNA-[protein]-cysteine S-methyltransferase